MNEIKRKTILLSFSILSLICGACSTAMPLNCLDRCHCFWIAERFEADCSRLLLESFPDFTDSTNVRINAINMSNNYFVDFPYYLSVVDDLTFIDLSNNYIKRLRPNALHGFTSLRNVILEGNNFSYWNDINPNTAFLGAKNLEVLSLAHNPITSFSNVDETYLIVSRSLIVLDLSHCQISKLAGEYMLSGVTSLEHLILNGNPLKVLTALASDTLKKFDLVDCDIEVAATNALLQLPRLLELNLSHNNGIALRNKLGDYVQSSSLITLDLSNCNLDVVDIFGFPQLTSLVFNGNLLKKLSASTFENNVELVHLDLSKNSINYIEADAFTGLKALKKLDLSYNVISTFESNMFAANTQLITLNLSQNFITRFHQIVSNSLIHLLLGSNDISKINFDALESLKSISVLDLSRNLFSTFPSDLHSKTLQVLDLSMCRLIKINNRTFSGFPELYKLDLSGNRFTKTFKTSYFRHNPFLEEIRLYDNLWDCDCNDRDFREFYEFSRKKNLLSHGRRLKEVPQCGHPTNLIENTWERTCQHVWKPKTHMGTPEKVWTIIFCSILVFVGCLCLYTLFQRFFRQCKRSYNQRVLRRNLDETREIQRQNTENLQQAGFTNAPSLIRESSPPCYEEALLMPKIDRSKSMGELNASSSQRNGRSKMQRTSTNADFETENSIVDRNRFLSEERLLDREKERSNLDFGYIRRQQRGHSTGNRLHSKDINYDSRFPPAHMKSQNLESAERIAVLKNSRMSPYSSRKWKMQPDSMSFASISDDELGIHRNSKNLVRPGTETDSLGAPKQSPYSRRRPRGMSVSQLSISRENIYDDVQSESAKRLSASNMQQIVVVENHFIDDPKKSGDPIESSISSEFDQIQMPSKEQSIESFGAAPNGSNNEQNGKTNLPIIQSKF